MSLQTIRPAAIPEAVMETILTGLAALFLTGAGGDMAAARHAASCMLDAYHPGTGDELRLAANIISFSFRALQALGLAAAPDMPLNRMLRLQGSAVSLSRESAKAERRLTQLQKAREQGLPVEAPAAPELPPLPEPRVEKAIVLIQETGTVAQAAKAKGITWTQAYNERQRDNRLAAGKKKAEARIAAPRA